MTGLLSRFLTRALNSKERNSYERAERFQKEVDTVSEIFDNLGVDESVGDHLRDAAIFDLNQKHLIVDSDFGAG